MQIPSKAISYLKKKKKHRKGGAILFKRLKDYWEHVKAIVLGAPWISV
jgi:hypothetical protein